MNPSDIVSYHSLLLQLESPWVLKRAAYSESFLLGDVVYAHTNTLPLHNSQNGNRRGRENLQSNSTSDRTEVMRIQAGTTGHSYENLLQRCFIPTPTKVTISEACVQTERQILNFVQFCETLISRSQKLKTIRLVTEEQTRINEVSSLKKGNPLARYRTNSMCS